MADDKAASPPVHSVRIDQTRVAMPPVKLNYDFASWRRCTRAQIMELGAATIVGNDSTTNQDPLPGQWTLVEETNMERREPLKVWRDNTKRATSQLSEMLKTSLMEYPHPMLSEKALNELEIFKNKQN